VLVSIARVACEPPLELLLEELLPDELLLLVDDPPAPEEELLELLLDELLPEELLLPDEPLLVDDPAPPLLDVLLLSVWAEVPPPPQAVRARHDADSTDSRHERRIVLPLIASKPALVKMSLPGDRAFRDSGHSSIPSSSRLLSLHDRVTVASMQPIIRCATPSDCAELVPLVEQYWRFEQIDGFHPERILQLLRACIAQPERSSCWVAGAPGAIHGYLLAVYMFSLEFGGSIAEIDELYVLDAHRSAGLGTALAQQAIAQMKQSGVMHVQLQVGVANRSARAFYERLGFGARAGYELIVRNL
jgi:ribosomal protein S18 acetylase RimI-like enzyme